MHLLPFSHLPLLFTSTVSAVGSAILLNNSTSTFYAWSVGAAISERQTVVSGGIYLEPLRKDPSSGGIAIKITRGPNGLYNGEPQQVFSYNLADGKVWYDLSDVFGAPFKGNRIEVTSTTGGDIIWPAGTNPGGSQLRQAPDEENVWFTVYANR
ncbi:hypothetical protein IQ06DRAFT_346787 [Phaeosphaeriaceae sp. SRC1lsM3a]|nr:hypothetical protein IQ06DRAFT_346787 [Stagonospora sp. SRC1lsM3a]